MSFVLRQTSKLLVYRNILQINTLKRKSSCLQAQPLKVTVCGAAGKIGQPLSLMLKLSPYINELYLYDLHSTCDMALDLNEIDTDCKVYGTRGRCDVKEAFSNASVLVILACEKDSKKLETEEMFEANRDIICEIAEYYAKFCPKALLALATQPVNTLVPLLSEQLKIIGAYDPKKIFGITLMNQIRANKFAAQVQGLVAECVKINCIGGGCGKTIMPILSHAQPCADFYPEEVEQLVEYVQQHRKKAPSITTAQSIVRFVTALLRAIRGEPNVVTNAYVRSNVRKGLRYLTNPLLLGPGGIQKNLGLPGMTVTEKQHLKRIMKTMQCEIKMAEMYMGIDHDKKPKPKPTSFYKRRGVPFCPDAFS